jgi:hypothetical protein
VRLVPRQTRTLRRTFFRPAVELKIAKPAHSQENRICPFHLIHTKTRCHLKIKCDMRFAPLDRAAAFNSRESAQNAAVKPILLAH